MTRGRKRKFRLRINLKPDVLRSLLALAAILLGLISLLSFFFPDYLVNAKVQEILRQAFGKSSFIVPFLLILIGLLFVQSLKTRIKDPRIIGGLTLLLLTLSSLSHTFVPQKKAEELAMDGMGGGIVGYKISSVLISTVSIYGEVVVLFISLVISLILISNISLDQAYGFVSTNLSNLKIGELLARFSGRSKGGESEVEVSSGGSMAGGGYDEDRAVYRGQAEEGPSFEVVPTMAEPEGSELYNMRLLRPGGASAQAPNLPYSDRVWQTPPLDFLVDYDESNVDAGDVNNRAKIIRDTLKSFGIEVEVVDIKQGPSVTQYSLQAESGTKVSKIANLQNDLALALASPTGSVRIEAPIPGKSLIGIEVPNNTRATVSFKSLITSEAMKSVKSKLGILLGKDVAGKVHTYDIGRMPHLLIAGTTGSGKSIFIHNILFSILYRATPQEVKFILVDPKRNELAFYKDIPHLYSPVVTDMEKAPSVFRWAVVEMEHRYKLFEAAKARNIEAYNEKSGFHALPYIVIVIDELADIMVKDPMGVEKSIIRLAQLARATGIHLVLAVQRPSTDIITGLIKANIPCRVAFSVSSQVDSRVIIDQPGAEKLLSGGDMLFVPPDASKPIRLQTAFISEKEINSLVSYLKSQGVAPEYKEEIFQMQDKAQKVSSAWGGEVDDLFDEAIDIVRTAGKASASLLQRKLSIGFSRAARIMDELEAKGIIGPPSGAKPREVLLGNIPPIETGEEENPIDSIQDL